MEKIEQINKVIEAYFTQNRATTHIPAKDLMPQFIEAGIFNKDHRNGLPIRKVLRDLDKKQSLHLIPCVYKDRKAVNTNWYFQRNDNEIIKLETVEKLLEGINKK